MSCIFLDRRKETNDTISSDNTNGSINNLNNQHSELAEENEIKRWGLLIQCNNHLFIYVFFIFALKKWNVFLLILIFFIF